MDLRFLGGAGEIGRSAVLVDDSLLLDFGMGSGDPPSYPLGVTGSGVDIDPDAVVVSHGHLDHAGAVPALLSGDARPPVHWTPPTAELAQLLARDTLKLQGGTYDCPFTETELKRLTQVSRTHGYREPFEAAGYEVTFYDAGHIPGSAHVTVDDGDTRLLYTGDYHTEDQRLLAGTTARPDADVVVTESTYADTTRPPRAAIEERFADSLRTTVWEGGTVVVPAFAIGRTQEVMCICERHDLDCYVDGMGQAVVDILARYADDYLRDPDAFRRATSNARMVTGRAGQRERIAAQNTVIITTAGMLNGGPVHSYLPEIRDSPTNTVAFTGYQVEGTAGRELLDTGSAEIDGRVMRVAARTEQYDFSAHADRDGLDAFLDSYRDTPVLVVHGDRTDWYADELADEGFDASAPAVGDTVTVSPAPHL
jgi:putative mRNA 3-end processing factor